MADTQRIGGKYAFTNCHLLDGTLDERGEMPVQDGMMVLVDGERIVDVVPDGAAPAGYRVLDLQGGWLLPGLINLHAHIASSGKPPKPNAKPVDYKALFELLSGHKLVMKVFLAMEKSAAKNQLLGGVTTLRTVGGVMDHDGIIRDQIARGEALGPRMLVCNTGVSVPGGHFAGSLATESASPQQAAQDVVAIAQTNPDWIKLMITGGVMDASEEGEPSVLRMPPEVVRAACDAAHDLGFKVAAHVESPEGVRVALENGVDTIEHGAKPDQEILDLFRRRNQEGMCAQVCTISPALPYAIFPLEESHAPAIAKKNGAVVMEGIIECAKACLSTGIPVGLGTDSGCPFITQYDMWREVYYFAKYCQVTPGFALYSATLGNARILGMEDRIGSIEPGKLADLIVCEGNPLEDLTALRKLRLVMCGGRLVEHPLPKKMKRVEELLDRYLDA